MPMAIVGSVSANLRQAVVLNFVEIIFHTKVAWWPGKITSDKLPNLGKILKHGLLRFGDFHYGGFGLEL